MPPCRVGCHIRFKHETHILNILNETSQSNHAPTKKTTTQQMQQMCFRFNMF